MIRTLSITAVAALFALGTGLAWAQETSTDTTEPDTEESSTEDAVVDGAGGLSMGEPSDTGEAGIGQTYIVQEFGDWSLNCIRVEEGEDPCQLYQLLRDETGRAVAEFSIFPLAGGGQAVAGATIITPLETLLTEQVRLTIDSGETRRYPFAFCSQLGCFSRLGFTQAEVDAFKRGANGQVSITPAAAADQSVDLTVSLSGFTAGFNALSERLAAGE